ncbi:MAG TPA: NAD-dependent epimerase/dehydratase family protein [Acidimicrobiales bacterium]|nr:NAD-dependent epimerase/dehydratase family protein [Acidimicrobiales bacterium]
MRVLVTGGSGFIGRHLVRRLAARGDEPVVADLLPFPDPAVPAVVGDLRDRAVVDAAFEGGVDAVVHLAALTSVLRSVNEPHEVFTTNVDATELLLEGCRARGVARFVFASTNAVAGDVGARRIDEELPLHPLTPYGATKAAAEMLLSAYAASYGLHSVALRFTNVYGAGMQAKDSVVARLMRAALAGGGIEIYGDGEQLRDYLYVSDAVQAIELGLRLETATTVTVGAGESVSMNELHRLACEVTGVEIGKEHVPGRPGEMPAVVVDTKRARALGFSPAYSLREGLAETWADFVAEARGGAAR